MPRRVELTSEQVVEARRLWAGGATADEIAAAVGISIDVFRARLRDQLANLQPRDRRANSGRRGAEPSPTEIRVACAMLRENWPDERFHSSTENAAATGGRETAAIP
jgi:hypothetical protein